MSEYRIGAAVAVPDVVGAREFYEGKLGLSAVHDDPYGDRTYACGAATNLHVFPSAHTHASRATVVGLQVDDIERVVDELTAKHVAFERTTKRPDHGQARHRPRGLPRR